MSTDIGKEMVLNPKHRTPILEIFWKPKYFADEVKYRVDMYVRGHLQSDGVGNTFREIIRELESFIKKAISEISCMENDWTDDITDIIDIPTVFIDDGMLQHPINSVFAEIGSMLGALAVGGLSIAFPVLLIPLAFSLGAVMFMNQDEIKQATIDKEYNRSMSVIRSKIIRHLDSTYGDIVLKLVNKVTTEILPRRFRSLEKMIQQLLDLRKDILNKQDLLRELAKQVRSMETDAGDFQKCLKHIA